MKAGLDLAREFIAKRQKEIGTGPQPTDAFGKWVFSKMPPFLKQTEEALKDAKVKTQGRTIEGQMQAKADAGTVLAAVGGWYFVAIPAAPSRPVPPPVPR